jgi:hypothetical protein
MGDTKRDSQVVRMRREGISFTQICERFRISHSRVGQIVSAFRLEEQQREGFCQILRALRSEDNIDKKWPKEIIMECLLFPKVYAWRLERHFQKESILELSLRDLMDFLISGHIETGQNLYQVMPALSQFNVGWKTYTFLVRRLSQQDLGAAFNTEWALRIGNVVLYLQKKHAYIPSVLKDIAISLGLF